MADFNSAILKTLKCEGGFIHVKATGEVANWGVTFWFLRSIGVLHGTGPASAVELKYVQDMTREEAVQIYYRYFWCDNSLGSIRDQALADKVFDLCVNMGSPAACRMLQLAANAVSERKRLAVDGEIGEHTLALLNELDAGQVLAEYRRLAEQRYREIATRNPNLTGDLPEWLRRLAA